MVEIGWKVRNGFLDQFEMIEEGRDVDFEGFLFLNLGAC